jgi:hypothetical protein
VGFYAKTFGLKLKELFGLHQIVTLDYHPRGEEMEVAILREVEKQVRSCIALLLLSLFLSFVFCSSLIFTFCLVVSFK